MNQVSSILLTVIACLACISCASGPSVTRTKNGTYHVSAGHSLIAKQESTYVEINTQEGDTIKVHGLKQKADGAVVTGLNWWGAGLLSKIFYAHETAKVTEAAGVEKAGIAADVKKTEIGAGVVNNANAGRVTLEALPEVPAQLPR